MSFELFKNVVAVVLQFWKSFPTLNFPHPCLVLNKQKAAKQRKILSIPSAGGNPNLTTQV